MFEYSRYFNKALDQVKALRDPYARKQEIVEAGWYSILRHQIVNFGAADFRRPMDVIDGANDISIVCIYSILLGLIAERAPHCKMLHSLGTIARNVIEWIQCSEIIL